MHEVDIKKREAIERIRDHMRVHKLNEPQAHFIHEVLELAINALENVGCGCSLRLAHNGMRCPRMTEDN